MKIAFSSADITPLEPQYVCGHAMRSGKSAGVHDPLELNVLWLDIDGVKCCFINADLIMMSKRFCDEMRSIIAEKYAVAESLIVLSVTHTHSAPNFNDSDSPMMAGDQQYIDEVKNKLLAAVEQANQQYQDFNHVICHRGWIEGYYGNRNDLQKQGDKWAYYLEFKMNEQVVATMANLSCHSTINSPLELNLSADLLGNIRRELFRLKGIEPLMSNGAAGDMSNRQYRQNNDWNELNRVSQGIARQMADLAETIDLNIKPVRYQTVEYQVSYQRDKKALQGILETLQANLEKETSFDGKKWLYSEIAGYEYKLQNLAIDVCLNTEVIRLGDLELIIVPCELASNLGLQLKRSSNAKVCIVWGYANGSAGYIVEASEFNGGHDGILTDLKRGQAEEYIGKVIQKMF